MTGALQLLASSKYLTTAGRILSVESYQSGIIRDELYQSLDKDTPYNLTVADLVDAIALLRAKVGKGNAEVRSGLLQKSCKQGQLVRDLQGVLKLTWCQRIR